MKNFLLTALVAVVLLIIPEHEALSQTTMKLNGTVSDSSKSLPLVTVRIFKKNSTVPLQTVLSKDNGSFQLNKPDTGTYTLSFTHTGFAEKRITITVTAATGDVQINRVQLSKATGMLKEVVVQAQRPMVEQ
jgi:hypothetical protein